MLTVSYEFPDKESAKKALDSILKKSIATGEIELKPQDAGTWLMKIHAEKDVKDSAIEKLGGTKIEA
jgi:hypothetical protein